MKIIKAILGATLVTLFTVASSLVCEIGPQATWGQLAILPIIATGILTLIFLGD